MRNSSTNHSRLQVRPSLKLSFKTYFPHRTSESFKIWRWWNTAQREDPGWRQDRGSQWWVILPWRTWPRGFLAVTIGERFWGILWVQARDAAEHPTYSIHRGWASWLRKIHSKRGTSQPGNPPLLHSGIKLLSRRIKITQLESIGSSRAHGQK